MTAVGTVSGTGRSVPFPPPEDAPVRLFCLPHAGAGASAYRAWARGLPSRVGVCPLQPPGRETRMRERALASVEPLVAELADDLAALLDRPYAVLGHSVGAVVAFELVREIRRRGGPPPVHLVVSGRAAPQLPHPRPPTGELTPDRLAGLLRDLGGTDAAVLADQALMAVMAPLFEADFAVNETYRYRSEPPLDVPITAFRSTGDPRAAAAPVAAWAAQTTREFRSHVLGDGHFALLRHPERAHAVLAAMLAGEG